MSHSPFFMHAGKIRAKVRAEYDLYLQSQHDRASDDTNGVLLNRRGRDAGVTAWSLFSGPLARAEAYASEELREWWAKHGRVDFESYELQAFQAMHAAPAVSEPDVLPSRELWEAERRAKREAILSLRSAGRSDREIAAELDLPLTKVRNAIQYAQRKARKNV